MQVTLVYSPSARQVVEKVLHLAEASTVEQALQASAWLSQWPELGDGSTALGVWGRKCSPAQTLREGDRVEWYRALTVDPKVARRERFAKQGARTTGLFARGRANSPKPK